jgi:hypothetical protein
VWADASSERAALAVGQGREVLEEDYRGADAALAPVAFLRGDLAASGARPSPRGTRLAMSPAGISPRACTSRASFITDGETPKTAISRGTRRKARRSVGVVHDRASGGDVGDSGRFDPTSCGDVMPMVNE